MPWGLGTGCQRVASPGWDARRGAGPPDGSRTGAGDDPPGWDGRVSAAVVVLSVLLSSVALSPGVVAATGGSGGVPAVGSAGAVDLAGSGTPGDPYRIASVSGLQSMREDLDAHYLLVADVDASGTAAWNGGRGFDPVGDPNGPFNGTFDGGGHTVSGLVVDRPATAEVGLFGRLGDGGTVTGVVLEDATVSGRLDVGALAGLNDGGSVTDSSATGSVNGTDAVGGLVGLNDRGVVREAAAGTTVTGEGQVGGLVGLNYRGRVGRADATGTVTGLFWVGGLVGQNLGTVSDATAGGAVTGVDSVGGLVGHNSQGTVSASLASGAVDAETFVGGLVGSNVRGTVERSGATGRVAGVTLVGGLVGRSLEGGTVTETFAAGPVTGEWEVGGLVGESEHPVAESYWDTEASGLSASDGGRGLTTAEMTGFAAPGNMTGFDVPGTWRLTGTYPTLPRGDGGPFLAVEPVSLGDSGPVAEGEVARVEAIVTNYGQPGTGTLTLYDVGFDDARRDEATVTLDPGESETVTLSWRTRRGDNGTGSLTVASGSDADSVALTVTAVEGDGDDDTGGSDGSSGSRGGGGGAGAGGGGGGSLGAEPPGEVDLAGATLETPRLAAGEEALVAVSLSNVDPASGRITLALDVDDGTVAERTVSVAASTERTVSLAHRFEAPGTYALSVNGVSAGSLTVETPTTPTPSVTPTSASTASSSDEPPASGRSPTPAATPDADADGSTPGSTAAPTGTTRTTTGTPAAGPGFSILTALLALASVSLLARRPD